MLQPCLKQNILKHIHNLDVDIYKSNSETIVKSIAMRFDVPREVAEKILADWSAGKE